jgi:hypothetical protein
VTITAKRLVMEVLQRHIGVCREWVGHERCGAPSEFILWGKLIDPEGLGPRCYDHAVRYVGHSGLSDPSYAVIGLERLAREVVASLAPNAFVEDNS